MRFQLRSLVAAVALVCSLAADQKSRAVDVTFDLTQLPFGQTTSSLTSSGYTLQFSSIGGVFIVSTTANSGGLAVLPNFSMSKTAGATDLIFKSYQIGNLTNYTGNLLSFSLTGGTGTSTGNTFTALTSSNYNGSYSLVGSQTVTFSMNNFGSVGGVNDDTVYFNSLTFSTVPEPSTYALAAIGTGMMAAIARRRKARKG